MTNDLSATASTPPEEEALPVRQRATAAQTRLIRLSGDDFPS